MLVVDPSDSRLMDNCCIYMFCVNLRNRADFSVIHDNRVALYVSMAEIFTDCSWVKYLPGAAFCNGSGYDLCRASSPSFLPSYWKLLPGFPCVISFSITYSFEFASRYTLFSRTVESTPFICAVSSVKTEFSPR